MCVARGLATNTIIVADGDQELKTVKYMTPSESIKAIAAFSFLFPLPLGTLPSNCFLFFHFHTIKMAPAVLETQPTAPHQLSSLAQKPVDRKIFPDGIKTSGQHPPLYDLLSPYSDFPKEITGKSIWEADDYANNPERWVHVFNDEEIDELSVVAGKFIADRTPLVGISKVSTGSLLKVGCQLTLSRTPSNYRSCPFY